MNFLTPAAFFLAGLLPVIVAMYLLKLRRTEQAVSSVYLWRRLVRDVEANAPWQRLRRNLLLILQLLFLAALILALARPFTWAEGASSQATIFILDTSASMAAVDADPNRLEAAKTQATQMIDDLPDDARITVIAAGEGAQVLVASSQDRRQVHLAVDGIQVSLSGSDLTAALQLTSAIAARQPDTEIVILSDGQVSLPEYLVLNGRVRYMPLGISGDNQAISMLSMRPTSTGDSLTVFTQVVNYSDQSATRRLEIYADGQLVNAHEFTLSPGERRAYVTKDLLTETGMVEARLSGQDVLPLDDRAWTVPSGAEPITVTLVTAGNLFLETALMLFPNVEVTLVDPADYEQSQALTTAPELTIFDVYVPPDAPLPDGSLLFIAPTRGTDYFSVTGVVDQPTPRSIDPTDPLLAHVNLTGVNILDAVQMPLPAWGRMVIAGDADGTSTPLLFAGVVEGRRTAVLAFDLHHSDLPLQVAFPLLVANLVNWLSPGMEGELPTQITAGAPAAIELPLGTEFATVTRPDGSRLRQTVEDGDTLYLQTMQLGVYQVNWGETGEVKLAVNLFSPQESDVRPAGTLSVTGLGDGEGDEALRQARREWWRPLAYFALGAMTAEWLVYNRATLSRLWGEMRQRGIESKGVNPR